MLFLKISYDVRLCKNSRLSDGLYQYDSTNIWSMFFSFIKSWGNWACIHPTSSTLIVLFSPLFLAFRNILFEHSFMYMYYKTQQQMSVPSFHALPLKVYQNNSLCYTYLWCKMSSSSYGRHLRQHMYSCLLVCRWSALWPV